MNDKEKLSLALYNIIISIKDTLCLPTHATLLNTFFFSAGLFACSLLSSLLGFYTFIGWPGSLICTLLLGILLYIERSENDALSRMYRSAKLSAQQAVRRAANAGACQRGRRNPANPDEHSNSDGR